MGRSKGERKKENGEKTRTLVIRLSALGDVAMTIPVLYSVANRYPDDEFLCVTKKSYHSVFINPPENLKIIPVDTKEKELLSVVAGLIKKEKIDRVADLHNVLRSWITDLYVWMKGAKIAIISKGRTEKKELVRRKNKRLRPLETSVERYQKVFERLGYDASPDFKSL
jgi:ADP-heptose:LPS heptosyltransferase